MSMWSACSHTRCRHATGSRRGPFKESYQCYSLACIGTAMSYTHATAWLYILCSFFCSFSIVTTAQIDKTLSVVTRSSCHRFEVWCRSVRGTGTLTLSPASLSLPPQSAFRETQRLRLGFPLCFSVIKGRRKETGVPRRSGKKMTQVHTAKASVCFVLLSLTLAPSRHTLAEAARLWRHGIQRARGESIHAILDDAEPAATRRRAGHF